MAGESKAKVIPLHSNTGRQAAQRRAAARGEAARRHPSLLSDPNGRASAEQIAAVVREIDDRRAGATGSAAADESPNELPLGIGRDAVLDRVIVDKNARIGHGARLVNERGIDTADGDGYYIRGGIIIVPKGGVVKPGTVV